MTCKDKQVIEIKECIDAVYGADCAYFDVDGFAIANEIYNAGYRKQSEGEWVFNRGRTYGEPAYYCSNCSEGSSEYGYDKYCPNCGAHMKGANDESAD